jgi:peptide/nickel transport system permease protein
VSTELLVASPELADVAVREGRGRPSYLIVSCLAFLAVVLAMALAPVVIHQDPNTQNLFKALATPQPGHLLGTDSLGRDVLIRLVFGARTAVIGPIIIAVGAMIIGSVFGLLAGYKGGWFDAIILRFVDLMYALPGLLVAMVVVGVVGGGYAWSVALLTLLYSPTDIRIIRAATLEQRVLPYVEASRVLGLSQTRIMARVIWPNILPLIVANTFLHFAYALVSLAALSFLGLGVSPSTPDWGRMLADGRTHLFDDPAIALAPAFMLVLTAASMNLVGDWLFEKLSERGRAR